MYTGLEYVNAYYKTIREWFIPVHTGQMIPFYRFGLSAPVHPHAYGVDTKVLKRIPVVSKPVFRLELSQQNQYVPF